VPQQHPVPATAEARRDRLLAGACLTLLTGVASLWMMARPGVPGLDSWLHRAVVQHRGTTSLAIARAVTQGGSPRVVWPLLALATLLYPRTTDRKRLLTAGVFAAALGAGVGVRLAVSIFVARARPATVDWAATAGGYAFPSGHTTAATLGAGALAWAVAGHTSRSGVRLAAWGPRRPTRRRWAGHASGSACAGRWTSLEDGCWAPAG
jgi:hypothetical protein